MDSDQGDRSRRTLDRGRHRAPGTPPGGAAATPRRQPDRPESSRREATHPTLRGAAERGATPDGLPAARKLIVLPSRAMAGIPIEVLLTAEETRSVGYAPSATVYKSLRELPRPDRHVGLLALGDPVYMRRSSPATRRCPTAAY